METKLSKFRNASYAPGRRFLTRSIWFVTNVLFVLNPLNPFSQLRAILLKMLGGKIGQGVVLKPSINIKYPWNLEIGDNSWIGESVLFDSLDKISIGSNVCISQGAYLCTGNHDYTKEAFDLIVRPIVIEDGVWVGAKAVICPGVTLRSHSVITAGSVVTKDTEPYGIYQGNPAQYIRKRVIAD
ncbi:MAG: WcaF family extracellular polysaccharide biosynthesis acetyltransferase [Nitrospirae bacterium]|nr:WcaF family extracellular polysaccharide biosynthesis acetyltransferase [Nitrospirota bacterium]